MGILFALQEVPGVGVVQPIAQFLHDYGALGALVLFVVLLLTDQIYTKGRYRDLMARFSELKDRCEKLEQDRDEWREVAREQGAVLPEAVSLAKSRPRRRAPTPG